MKGKTKACLQTPSRVHAGTAVCTHPAGHSEGSVLTSLQFCPYLWEDQSTGNQSAPGTDANNKILQHRASCLQRAAVCFTELMDTGVYLSVGINVLNCLVFA